jgi:hypothetical protein
MENELTWIDRNITPRTTAYKGFIAEMKNTSPEKWFQDGERVFTEKEKKFMAVYNFKNQNEKTYNSISHPYSIAEGNRIKYQEKYTNLPPKRAVHILLENKGRQPLTFIDNRYDISIKVDNPAITYKIISDLYAKELNKKTDLSTGLTNSQIDEKQSHYYRKYESEAKKIGIEVTPLFEKDQGTVIMLADFFKKENSLWLISGSSYREIDSFKSLIENLERGKKMWEGIPIILEPSRSSGEKFAITIHNDLQRKDFLSELYKLNEKYISVTSANREENTLKAFADKLQAHYEIKDKPSFNFSTTEGLELLEFVINVSNMKEEVKDAILHYLVVQEPVYPERADWADGSFDGGLSYYEKAVDSYETREMPKFNQLMSSFEKVFAENNIAVDKFPQLLEIEGWALLDLVDELEKYFPNETQILNPDKLTIYNSLNQSKDFIISDIKVSSEQFMALAENQEFNTSSIMPLTSEQLSKIPDVIEGSRITDYQKLQLASGRLEIDPGTSFFIQEKNIVKNSLNESLINVQTVLQSSDVSFDRSQLKGNIELEDGKIKDITEESITNITFYKNNINNQNPNIMETQNEYEPAQYPKFQLKYLGFGEGEQLHKDLENGINAPEKEFEIKTTSDKTMPGNEMEFTLKFNKIENGSVFMNFYNAKLTKENGDILSHNFPVNRVNTFTAKEAVNLLEGRTVKIEFHNPKTEKIEPAFAKLNFNEPKTEKGNYNFQNFYKNYGVDTVQIVEKSKLIFDKPEWKESTIKSLEKGNIVKVKFELDDKVVEGKAVLNPQYKNLNLYDSDMNRINTNKPLEGLEQDNKHEKNNVKEQSIKR